MVLSVSLVIFILLAIVSIASAIFVVTSRNLFHATMSLGLFLLTSAGFFMLLEADFVSIMQIFVYVGGVIVMLLFGIMLTSQITNVRLVSAMQQKAITYLSVIALVAVLCLVAVNTAYTNSNEAQVTNTVSFIGNLFMTSYVLPFEIVSILLLAALIGAVVVAREGDRA